MQQNQDPYFSTKIEVPRATLAMVLGIVSIVLVLPAPFIGTTIVGIAGIICAGSSLMIISEAKTMLEQDPHLYLQEESKKKLKIGRTCSIIGVSIHFFMFALFWFFIIVYGRPAFAF
ncbi:MAG: hypothetical protein FD123_2300 [Bacteroidetes bacterium]|nr:MAG: hypothetical protein FD123_2300 [Bacteroidota bacterium]